MKVVWLKRRFNFLPKGQINCVCLVFYRLQQSVVIYKAFGNNEIKIDKSRIFLCFSSWLAPYILNIIIIRSSRSLDTSQTLVDLINILQHPLALVAAQQTQEALGLIALTCKIRITSNGHCTDHPGEPIATSTFDIQSPINLNLYNNSYISDVLPMVFVQTPSSYWH